MSNSLRPHGLQHARLPCPSPTPRIYSNSCPSSQWCNPTISSSVVPFSSHLQSFPASGSFPVSQFFASDGQSIGVSASASVLIQDCIFRIDGLVGSPCIPRDSQESSPTPQFKSTNSSGLSFLYSPILTSIHDYWKNRSLTRWTFVRKVMSLLLNTLSRLVITFFQKSSILNFMAAVTICSDFGGAPPPKKKKSVSLSPSIFHEVLWSDAMILVFWMLSFLNVEHLMWGRPCRRW